MPALFTAVFARAFEDAAEATAADGVDPRVGLPDLVGRVVAQARMLNPDDWRAEIDAVCHELRMRLTRLSLRERTLLSTKGKRTFRREVYLQSVNLLEFARDADHG